MTMRRGFMLSAPILRAVRGGCIAALCLFTAACFATPEWPLAGPDPSDPSARTPAAAYRSVLGGYVSQRPVEPVSWGEQNERVKPAPKR
jgi:hypothetical protein